MMQRLREQTTSADPATARAAALLAAMPPLDGDRLRPRPLPAAEAGRRALAGRLRLALVFAITLGSVAAAAATMRGAGWLGRSHRVDPLGAAPAAPRFDAPASPSRTRPPSAGVDDNLTNAPPPVAAPEIAVEPAAEARASRTPTHHASPSAARASKDAARASTAKAIEEESALMVGAVRALRREGDPARALALAEESLRRYPHGVQVEEAMALSMEAAGASGNAVAARQAAQRYLASFPSGRFADRAGRILASAPK